MSLCSTLTKEKEIKGVLDVYRIYLDIWKIQNDNYFKRTQILMYAIQVALFTGFIHVAVVLCGRDCIHFITLLSLAGLGFFFANMWNVMIDKQGHYLEFCRRTLRNLEAELSRLGVPLHYFIAESFVFRPNIKEKDEESKLIIPESESIKIKKDVKNNKKYIVSFDWSKEEYPDRNSINVVVPEKASI